MNGAGRRSEWTYRDQTGKPTRRVVQVDPGKKIHQEHAEGDGWRSGVAGAPCTLLWLDELVKTQRQQLVVIVEGEPAAEAARNMLAGKAFVTTWPGGSGAAGKVDVGPLKGRNVVLWPDNDEPGGKAMQTLQTRLAATGVVARMFEPWPDIPSTGDAVDATDLGYGAQHFFDRLAEQAASEPGAFRVIDLADLKRPIKPVQWVWDQRIPRKEVTLLSGHGGAGKSMLALMLALHGWAGWPAWGAATERCRVAFYSAEDDESTLLRRVKFICAKLGLPEPNPDSGFFLLDANESPELYIPERSGNPATTTFAYEHLREFMATHRVDLLFVDGASDTFTGDEIRRAQVRAFVRKLAALARKFNAAVVLLAHVDKATSRGTADGTDSYSGSTAWHNSVRSRLYLSQQGAGRLVLEHQKSNHGPLAPALRFDWSEGDVPRLRDGPGLPDDESLTALLLELIGEATAHRDWIHTGPTSTRNAHRMLKDDDRFPLDLPRRDVFRLLNAAEKAGRLVRVVYYSDNRKPHERWGFPTEP